MEREKLDLTEEDGYRALRNHLVDRAQLARVRYGPEIDAAAIEAILLDSEIVRHPTTIEYGNEELDQGEFAWPRPVTDGESTGFNLVIHDHFAGRPEVLPFLAPYFIPTINYADLATHEEAELFGATLLGLDVEVYYQRLCELADELAALG